jgi:predicted transcriptional regulator
MNNSKFFENDKVVYLKWWFFNKYYSGAYEEHYGLIVKETEKAYQIVLTLGLDAADIKTWVPKSCTVRTDEELQAEIKALAEQEARSQARWEEACRKYSELVEYAQRMGVKGVKEGLRKETIIRKIEQAGIPLPA